MTEKSLSARLTDVERRVGWLEQWADRNLSESVRPMITPPMPLNIEEEVEAQCEAKYEPAPTAIAPPPQFESPPVAIEYQPVIQPPPALPRGSVEQAIGLKWSGWIGAIVLVVGAGLGIKFAYDSGWFATVPGGVWLALIFATGFALIGVGEWVHRRIDRVAAAGLYGAGVAILFVDSYAGFRYFELYPRQVAFALMGVATLCGAGVAMRRGLVSIAVLSLLGGHLAPALLSGPTPHVGVFFAYLLLLQGVGLVLSYWGGRAKWWTLRGLVFGGTAFWVWLVAGRAAVGGPTTCFLLFSAATFQAELILSAWKGSTDRAARRSVVFSTLVTAGLIAGLLLVLRDATDAANGLATLGVAGACLLLSFALPARKSGSASLAFGYRLQAAGLLLLAVPVGLTGASIDVGWGLLAVGYAVLALKLNQPVARGASVATWCFAVAHLLQRVTAANGVAPEFHLLGTTVTAYALEAWALAGVAQVIAICLTRGSGTSDQARRLALTASVLGTIAFTVASFLTLPPLAATLTLVVYAWALLAIDAFEPRYSAGLLALITVAFAAAKWATYDLLQAPWDGLTFASAPVLNPSTGVGMALVVTLAALAWLRREALVASLRRRGAGDFAERELLFRCVAGVVAVVTWALTFDVLRIVHNRGSFAALAVWPAGELSQLLWTGLWSAAVAGLLAFARWIVPTPRTREILLRVGPKVSVAVAVKFLLVDTLGYGVFGRSVPAMALFNVYVVAALAVAGLLLAAGLTRRSSWLLVLVLIVTGGVEINRAFDGMIASGFLPQGDAALAKQVALSIYLAVLAVLAVTAGFRWRRAGARHVGLWLFGLTLAKVVLIDLQDAGRGYRVLSFIGLGALLLGTSVLYGKLSPSLTRGEPAEAA